MGKKDKKGAEEASSAPAMKEVKKAGVDGGIKFDSSDAVIEAAQKQINLPHLSKPWTRDAWERARPFILEQRQKLESMGWSNVDGARTELFVLKKNAPAGTFTDDGSIYIRVPKKFIDFNRSGKAGAEEGAADEEAGDEGDKKKKKASRLSKKKENAPSYELNDPLVWKIKIENAESDDPARIPSVILDVPEPMENILYMVMSLQPGLIQLHASRKNVVQPGTKQSAMRDDAETPTVRHTAMVAGTESYTRTLPPAYWYKRNAESLQKVLNANGEESKEYEHTLAASENIQRAVTRDMKDVNEKTWEEKAGEATGAEAEGKAATDGAASKKGKKARDAPAAAVAAA